MSKSIVAALNLLIAVMAMEAVATPVSRQDSIATRRATQYNERISQIDRQGLQQRYDFPLTGFSGYQCVFKKSLILGNSLSAGTRDLSIPLLPERFGPSPAIVLTKIYANANPYLDKSDGTGYLTTGTDFIYELFREQTNGQKQMQDADTIVGVDMFYMSAIFNECGQGYDVEGYIRDLTDYVHENGKTLILGTVPHDTKDDYSWLARTFVLYQPLANCRGYAQSLKWSCIETGTLKADTEGRIPHSISLNSPQFDSTSLEMNCHAKAEKEYSNCQSREFSGIESCRQTINGAIRKNCSSAKGCYIADLESLVGRLKRGEKIKLSDGREYGLKQFRPDGVNVSNAGTQLIVESVLNSLKRAPIKPRCFDR